MKKNIRPLFPTLLITVLSFSFGRPFIKANALVSVNISDTSESLIRSYYSSLDSLPTSQLQGNNLLVNLKNVLASGHTTISYDGTTGTWAWFKITDRDWTLSPMTNTELANYALTKYTNTGDDDPYVRLLYRNDNGTATAAKFSDTHGTYIDREHVWPQSHGFKASDGATGPAGTDLHHLMLGDSANNQQAHNNYDWGEPTSSITVYGSTANHNNTGKNGTLTYGGVTGTVYEPQDSDKGDIARACFYMVARYSSYTGDFDPYLSLINGISGTDTIASNATTPATLGMLQTLLEWNTLDPVDDYEVHRNNLIYNNVQHNRNPFIDYPDWVNAVWGSGTADPSADDVRLYGETNTAPTALTMHPSSDTLTVGSTSTLTVSPTPSAASSSVTWSSNNETVATVSGGVVTAVSAGSATITATSTLDTNVKATCSITVSAVPVVTLSSITLSGASSTATLAGAYSTSGITVTAHYSDATTADVTSSAVINSPNTNVLGTQSVRVSYTEGDLTKDAYYSVKVTNQGASIGGTVVGTEYVSATAATGAIANWTNSGTGSAYADGAIKMDSSGDYVFNPNIWSGTSSIGMASISVTFKVKPNYGTPAGDTTTNNVITVFAINGNATTTIASVAKTAGFASTATDYTLSIIGISSSSTITGLRIEYTTKVLGNFGLYYVKATPTYVSDSSYIEQATAFANYVNDGIGSDAAGSCGSVFAELNAEYNYMAAESKTVFNSSTDEIFVNARARYNYIAIYTGNNGSVISGISALPITNDNADLMGIILIAIVGLTGVLVYSSSRRKEENA